jgi:hypothetical protein
MKPSVVFCLLSETDRSFTIWAVMYVKAPEQPPVIFYGWLILIDWMFLNVQSGNVALAQRTTM